MTAEFGGRRSSENSETSLATAMLADEQREIDECGSVQSSGGEEGGAKGNNRRFTLEEQTLLVQIIKEDPDLTRSFLHQMRTRQYDKKSWMWEIANRFNQRSKTTRTLDAIRHHFMLRKSAKESTKALIWHGVQCNRRETCSKCLLLDRYRVCEGLAKCGVKECKLCVRKSHLADAFEAFEPRELAGTLPAVPTAATPQVVAETKQSGAEVTDQKHTTDSSRLSATLLLDLLAQDKKTKSHDLFDSIKVISLLNSSVAGAAANVQSPVAANALQYLNILSPQASVIPSPVLSPSFSLLKSFDTELSTPLSFSPSPSPVMSPMNTKRTVSKAFLGIMDNIVNKKQKS